MAPAPLPPDWTCEKDEESGRAYFYNTATGESSWVRPEAEPPSKAPQAKGKQSAAEPPAAQQPAAEEPAADGDKASGDKI